MKKLYLVALLLLPATLFGEPIFGTYSAKFTEVKKENAQVCKFEIVSVASDPSFRNGEIMLLQATWVAGATFRDNEFVSQVQGLTNVEMASQKNITTPIPLLKSGSLDMSSITITDTNSNETFGNITFDGSVAVFPSTPTRSPVGKWKLSVIPEEKPDVHLTFEIDTDVVSTEFIGSENGVTANRTRNSDQQTQFVICTSQILLDRILGKNANKEKTGDASGNSASKETAGEQPQTATASTDAKESSAP